MSTNGVRAAIYLRVSRDDQTTENQRLVLEKVAERRGWLIVQTYEDQGISGAKGRDQRPAFDTMLKEAVRRQFDVLMVWSIDRLGRSVLHVANALAELDAAGVALYSDQQAIDSTTPMGRAMIQMASSVRRAGTADHPQQGSCRPRPRAPAREEARPPQGVAEDRGRHQEHLSAGNGILKVATMVGVGSGTVQRVKREMAGEFVRSHKVMDRYSKPPNLHQSNRTLKCRGHSIGRMTGAVPFVAASTVQVSA